MFYVLVFILGAFIGFLVGFLFLKKYIFCIIWAWTNKKERRLKTNLILPT